MAILRIFTGGGGSGSGSMTTVKEDGVQLGGADIEILDFLGADFDLTETPDKEVNITIAAAIARDSELHNEAHDYDIHAGGVPFAEVEYDDATSDPLVDADAASDGTENSAARKDHVHIKHHVKYTGVEAITDVENAVTLAHNGDVTIAGNKTLKVDVIDEKDAAAGVTIDSVLLKDGVVTVGDVAFDDATSDPLPADATAAADGVENSVARKDHRHFATAATATAQGISELATAAETSTGTDTARTIPVVALPIQIQDSKYVFAVDAEASDAYVITLVPPITAYAAGQVFHFDANTANTGAATLAVDGLAATTIKKQHDQDLATNDIEVGQFVTVIYDGTNFQMQSQVANNPGSTDGDAIHDNVAGEIVVVTEKTAPVGNDEIIIEDSADSNAKKSLKLSNLEKAQTSRKFSYSITVENPTSSEDITIAFTNRAITVTEMRAVLIGSSTPSVTWTIKHHATDRNNAGSAVVTASTATTSTTTGDDVTSFNDATIPADSYVWCETSAKSGTVTELHITIIGTED